MSWFNILQLLTQIILAGAALVALKQISISKNISRINSTRESIKYATDLVKDYLSIVVSRSNASTEALEKFKFRSFSQRTPCELKDFVLEEISDTNTPRKQHFLRFTNLLKSDSFLLSEIIPELNARESFATPFVSKVADETVAFTAVGKTFCESVERRYYALCYVRSTKHFGVSYFNNTVALYKIWSERQVRSVLENQQQAIENQLSQIEDLHIEPIGTGKGSSI